METGRAVQEEHGVFVKVLTDPVRGKLFVQKFGEITKNIIVIR
jgi:hypothetical protein